MCARLEQDVVNLPDIDRSAENDGPENTALENDGPNCGGEKYKNGKRQTVRFLAHAMSDRLLQELRRVLNDLTS